MNLAGLRRWREVPVYPSAPRRAWYLAIVVLVTVAIFYQTYVQGAVSTGIIGDFGMSLTVFTVGSMLGNAVGAIAALATGIADRWGRCNLIVGGLAVSAVLSLVVIPSVHSAAAYLTWYALLSLVGGVVLVATPALVRDFSPQLGRATAMGVWALGPVLGNLAISVVTTNTLDAHPSWQFQYRVAGAIGVFALVVGALWLRELAPEVRNQLMVSARDRALVQVRATAIREGRSPALTGERVRIWVPAIVLPAIGLGLYLMFYVTRVGFFVLYYVVNYGYSPSRANGLATWFWVSNAVAFVAAGVLSDRLRVRKPLMLGGTVVTIVGLAVFGMLATHRDTGYYTFAGLLVVLAAAGAFVSCTWLALFTEAVERISPAATARGMAVYGSVVRVAVVVTLIGFIGTVSAAGTLVDHGTKVTTLARRYHAQLVTLAQLSPTVKLAVLGHPSDSDVRAQALTQLAHTPPQNARTWLTLATAGQVATAAGVPGSAAIARSDAALTAAQRVPGADLAYLAAHGAQVARAAKDSPREWRTWWFLCLAGQLLFVPLSLLLRGRWSPRRAAEDAREHEELVRVELRRLRGRPLPYREQLG